MGLLSKIGSAISKVWKGIKTGFKSVLGAVGKALNSKLGKILMLAVSVFTLGTAFVAGAGAFTSTTGSFITKFIEGSKAFMGSLTGKTAEEVVGGGGKVPDVSNFGPRVGGAIEGTDAAAKSLEMGGALKGAGEAAIPAASNLGTAAGTVEGIGGVISQGQKALGAAGEMVSGGAVPAASAASQGGGGWLSKAASAAMEFAKSDGGQNIIGQMMQGYARSDELDRYEKIAMRGPNSFREGSKGMKALGDIDYSIDTPRDLAGRRGAKVGAIASGYQARVPYQQQGV